MCMSLIAADAAPTFASSGSPMDSGKEVRVCGHTRGKDESSISEGGLPKATMTRNYQCAI